MVGGTLPHAAIVARVWPPSRGRFRPGSRAAADWDLIKVDGQWQN